MSLFERLRAAFNVLLAQIPIIAQLKAALKTSQEDNARKDGLIAEGLERERAKDLALSQLASQIAALEEQLRGSVPRDVAEALEKALQSAREQEEQARQQAIAANAALAEERNKSAFFAADAEALLVEVERAVTDINANPNLPNLDPGTGEQVAPAPEPIEEEPDEEEPTQPVVDPAGGPLTDDQLNAVGEQLGLPVEGAPANEPA